MEKNFEMVATSNAKIDEMVKNYINDFYGKPTYVTKRDKMFN